MKAVDAAKIIIPNLVIVALLWEVLLDQAGRLAYFRTLGFTPSTAYYPFFYITSAVDGTTRIQGLLTLDWAQVLAVALILIDAAFVIGFLRKRKSVSLVQAPREPKI
ncbi:MAG: hypothetical protein OK441_05475 [Thaumarchaeota archaeon]|nr:hypothetical protein [Nitrososphaerota archaeon]